MKKYINTALLATSLGLCATQVLAGKDRVRYNPYQEVYVTISNQTGQDCIRIGKNFDYGTPVQKSPLRIYPRTTERFILANGMLSGPAMELTYQCGSERISFSSSQRFCSLIYGCQTDGHLVSSTPGITGEAHTMNASYYHNLHGEVNWILQSTP